nr:MAG TPA: hypothetical protein [Caudoviricetes sp.]
MQYPSILFQSPPKKPTQMTAVFLTSFPIELFRKLSR